MPPSDDPAPRDRVRQTSPPPQPQGKPDAPWIVTRLSILLALQYGSLGVWSVTFGTFIGANTGSEGAGIFSDTFLGQANTAGALGAIASPLLIGWLADRWLASELMLALLHAACAGTLAALYGQQTQAGFYICLLVYYQCYLPSMTLSNSLSMQQLTEPDRHFPFVRGMGTAGWMAVSMFVGFVWPVVFGDSIESLRTPILLGIGFHTATVLYCLTLPHTPPSHKSPSHNLADLSSGSRIVRRRPLLIFIGLSILACSGSQYYNLLNLYMNQQGFQYAAAKQSFAQVTEVIALVTLPAALAWLGLKRLFLIGLVSWLFRYLALAAAGYPGWEWLLVPAIGIHGLSFVYVYQTGPLYVDRMAGPRSRGTAQGWYALATLGVGHIGGSMMVGWLQSVLLTPAGVTPPPYNWTPFWLAPATSMAVVAVLFALLFSERHPQDADTDPADPLTPVRPA